MNAPAANAASPAKKADPATKVITGKVRGSYVSVFRARHNDMSGKDEFSMTILIPKSDTVTLAKIKTAIMAAGQAKFTGSFDPKAGYRMPVRDGDTDPARAGDEAYKGHYFINLRANDQPEIVDQQRQPVIQQNAFVSGDYCRVSMNAFGYDKKGKGVAFGLNSVQILAKGEPLSNRSRAEDDFDDGEVADAAGAAGGFDF